MKLYPIMVNISKRYVVIIGGGEVAYRKAQDLLESKARVKVIAPMIHEGFKDLLDEYGEKLEVVEGEYYPGDLKDAALVFSATNDSKINHEVYEEARDRNIFINSVDDISNCTFYVPSFIRRGDLIVSVSTTGASPAMAARLRRMISKEIPENIEETLILLDEIRDLLKNSSKFSEMDSPDRGRLLKRIVGDDALIEQCREASEEDRLETFLTEIV